MSSLGLLSCFTTLTGLAVLIIIYPLGYTLRKRFIPFLASIVIMVVLAYHQWGSYPAWQQYTHRERAEEKARALLAKIKSPDELIKKLKAHLDSTPASARGWYLLGRLYSNQGDWLVARDAFAKSYELNSKDEQVIINYANSVWQLNQQHVNEEIRSLLKQLLQGSPNHPDALAMLALDAYEDRRYSQAIDYWQQLLKLTPSGSAEASALRKVIAKAYAKQH